MSWAGPAVAASIFLIALAARSTLPPANRQDLAAAFADDDLPTAWAYMKAARRSPEALDALLDRQARQSISASARFFAGTGVSPTVSLHADTIP
jgi:hypothetical protein